MQWSCRFSVCIHKWSLPTISQCFCYLFFIWGQVWSKSISPHLFNFELYSIYLFYYNFLLYIFTISFRCMVTGTWSIYTILLIEICPLLKKLDLPIVFTLKLLGVNCHITNFNLHFLIKLYPFAFHLYSPPFFLSCLNIDFWVHSFFSAPQFLSAFTTFKIFNFFLFYMN